MTMPAQVDTKAPHIAPSIGTGIRAVVRHELRMFLYSPLTYIFQVGFLAALAACTFMIADYYAGDEASVRPMLVFLPWISLILVPALAMRAWTDEHGDRGIELVMTLPIPLGAVVVGKFLAGYVVLLVTLAFTAPFAATAFYLGEPDPGVTIAVYVAAALLLGLYYAVSLLASSLAREPVGAFIIGVVLLFVLLLLGWDVFGRLLHGRVPATVIAALATYSPKTWLDGLSRGLLDFAGIAYFIVMTMAALWATAAVAGARRRGALSLARAVKGVALGAVVIAALALVIPQLSKVPLVRNMALDLTAEGEFTLAEGTVALLDRLPQDVNVTFFWSAGQASVPNPIKTHARRIRDLLDTLAARSEGKIQVRTVDPEPDTDDETTALGSGIRRVPMSSGDQFFLGATFAQGDRVGQIPYFDIRRAGLLEYDIAVALKGLSKKRTPKIGILSPLVPSMAAIEKREGFSFIDELKQAYDMAVIPYFKDTLPEDLDVVILIDASILKKEMLYAIDQFVMRGGSLVVMMDPYLRFNPQSNLINPEPGIEINDISDLILAYGVRYEGLTVVGDETLAASVATNSQLRMSYPYWMRLGPAALSSTHATTASLNEVFFVEPGALTLVDKDRATALLTTTAAGTGTRNRKDFSSLSPRELALDFKPGGQSRVVAATITGPFQSAFKEPPEGSNTARHSGRSTGTPSVFIAADVDWLFDPFSLQSIDVGGRTVVRPLNDNLTFLLNMVEYASGDAALISIRSRGRLQRPFSRVSRLFREAEGQFREEESKLARQVAEIESRISQKMGTQTLESLDQLPPSLRDDVGALGRDLLAARKNLRHIRRRIREQVDALGARLIMINLAAGPLLSLLLAVFAVLMRRRRRARLYTTGTGSSRL